MTEEEQSRRVYPFIILWIFLAFPLAIFFTDLLGAYLSYWDMMWAGEVLYLLLCVLPMMLLLFLIAGTITSVIMRARNYDGWKIFLLSVSNMIITFVIAFAYEVMKSFNYPTSKTGSTFEFLLQYFLSWK